MRTDSTWTLGKSTGGRMMWLLAAAVFLLPSTALATTVSVDCNGGGSINAALSGLDLEGPHTIIVTGTCHENVVIRDRERLTIVGAPTATIVAADPGLSVIRVVRSRSIGLAQLVITGGSNGLVIQRSEVTADLLTIQNNSFAGVAATQQSSVQFLENVVQNNGGSGITVNLSSRLEADDSTIQNNAGSGIVLANSSSSNIVGDTIQNNGGFGVLAFHTSSYQLIGSTITGNGSTGVQVQETSHAEIVANIIRNNGAADPANPGGVGIAEGGEAFIEEGNDISNNTGPGVLVMTHGTLSSLGGNTINNNTAEGVNLRRQSVGQFFAADTISGNGAANLACDTTSLAAGDLTGVTNIKCKEIERELGPPRPGHIKIDPGP
jgi:hypothetical protein